MKMFVTFVALFLSCNICFADPTQEQLEAKSFAETKKSSALYSQVLAICSIQEMDGKEEDADYEYAQAIINSGDPEIIELGDDKYDSATNQDMVAYTFLATGDEWKEDGDESFEDGMDYWNMGDYTNALDRWNVSNYEYNRAMAEYDGPTDSSIIRSTSGYTRYQEAAEFYLASWYN